VVEDVVKCVKRQGLQKKFSLKNLIQKCSKLFLRLVLGSPLLGNRKRNKIVISILLKTINQTVQTNFREKGSKFVGYLFPAASVESFDAQLHEIKSDHPAATHHCYGWRLHPNKIEEFAQDDGEPTGTAGLPILNNLKSYEAVNCGCVVVRYYGGTKLGKSGLIQAYGRSAKLCLQKSSLLRLNPTKNFQISYPYDQQKHINQLKNSFDLKEIEAEYLEKVTLEIACRSNQAEALDDALKKLSHKGIETETLGDGFITMQT